MNVRKHQTLHMQAMICVSVLKEVNAIVEMPFMKFTLVQIYSLPAKYLSVVTIS